MASDQKHVGAPLPFRKNESGYSLVELCVVLTLLATLSVATVADISSVSGALDRQSALSNTEQFFRRARAESMAIGVEVSISIAEDGRSLRASSTHLVDLSSSDEHTRDFTLDLPSAVSIAATDSVKFNSSGFLVNSSGELQAVSLTLAQNGDVFCNGQINSLGIAAFLCK